MITEKIISDMIKYYNDSVFMHGTILPRTLESFIVQQINNREKTIREMQEVNKQIEPLVSQLNKIQDKCSHWKTKVVDEKVVCEDCGKVLK